MKNTALQVVLDNTDGVTVAKLARTAKIELTPVHLARIPIGKKECMKNKWMQLVADNERYLHGDIPVEFRDRTDYEKSHGHVGTFCFRTITNAYWVDGTRVIIKDWGPFDDGRDEEWLLYESIYHEEVTCRSQLWGDSSEGIESGQ